MQLILESLSPWGIMEIRCDGGHTSQRRLRTLHHIWLAYWTWIVGKLAICKLRGPGNTFVEKQSIILTPELACMLSPLISHRLPKLSFASVRCEVLLEDIARLAALRKAYLFCAALSGASHSVPISVNNLPVPKPSNGFCRFPTGRENVAGPGPSRYVQVQGSERGLEKGGVRTESGKQEELLGYIRCGTDAVAGLYTLDWYIHALGSYILSLACIPLQLC